MAALQILLEKLISFSVLAFHRKKGRYTVETDACDCQIGYVVLQRQDDNVYKPAGNWSNILNDREGNLDTGHQDCVAVVCAILLLLPYLAGTKLTVLTDRHTLKGILNLTDATGKPARWRLRVMAFDFDVLHYDGVKQQAADA